MSISYHHIVTYDDVCEHDSTGIEHDECMVNKGSRLVLDVVYSIYLYTKVRTTDGEFIPVDGPKLLERSTHKLIIQISMLENKLKFESTWVKKLVKEGLDESASRDFVSNFIRYADEHAVLNKDKQFKIFTLSVTLMKDVLGLLKKERRLILPYRNDDDDDDDDEDCSICAMELSNFMGGKWTVRTPCSHVFHYNCILPWLIENKSCPNCWRIVR